MLCRFKKMNTEWICPDCGRRAPISDKSFCPSAICRLPPKDNVHQKQSYKKNIDKFNGPGKQLYLLLKNLFSNSAASLSLLSIFNEMNNGGVNWCKSNEKKILTTLKQEALYKNIKYSPKGAKLLLRLSYIKTYQTIPH